MHAAVPIGLTPELVHLIRVNFVRESPWVAEADLLLSSVCRDVGGGFFEIDEELRRLLIEELQRDPKFGPDRLSLVADFLGAWTERVRGAELWRDPEWRDFVEGQALTALSFQSPERAAHALATSMSSALGGKGGGARFIKLTQGLSAALMSQVEIVTYAVALNKLNEGDREGAMEHFNVLGPANQPVKIGNVTLPAPAELGMKERREEPTMTARPRNTTAFLPTYEHDLFISYAHEDADWVSALQKQLTERLLFRLGGCNIWQDEKNLTTGENITQELYRAIRASAAFIAVLSPSYSRSDWCARERKAFLDEAEKRDRLEIGGYGRLLKVVKFPWEENAHRKFYSKYKDVSFYGRDAESGTEREFWPTSEAFRKAVDELSFHIEKLFEAMLLGLDKVFVAHAPEDASEERESIIREIRSAGFAISPPPVGAIPKGLDRRRLLEFIGDARVSVHLLGATFDSAVREQIDLGREAGKKMVFYLVRGHEVASEKQKKLIEEIRANKWNLPAEGWGLLDSRSSAVRGHLIDLLRTPRRAGQTRVNPRDGLTYVWIPPGKFIMGCSPGDEECNPDENPAHEVTITKGFWIGQTPVTQEAYQQVVGKNPSYFKGPRLPVEMVTWEEAQAYCQAIGMRLPTEAEWEYAARAGSKAASYGELDQVAWHRDNSERKTHDVGQKQPNIFGLYDMLGNVWEWVADWFDENYYGQSTATDPPGPATTERRVHRGGSWDNLPSRVRASVRGRDKPSDRGYRVGFRCVGELL
jgi:formylglycine-generating enzyme required for sulfatase activity